MAKEPTSVRSVRLPNRLWEYLTTEGERDGNTPNGIIFNLVQSLWEGDQPVTPKSKPVAAAEPKPGTQRLAGYHPVSGEPIYEPVAEKRMRARAEVKPEPAAQIDVSARYREFMANKEKSK